MSLYYYYTNNSILEHVVAWGMSNSILYNHIAGDCGKYSILHDANVFIVEDSICLHLGGPSD